MLVGTLPSFFHVGAGIVSTAVADGVDDGDADADAAGAGGGGGVGVGVGVGVGGSFRLPNLFGKQTLVILLDLMGQSLVRTQML